MHLGAVGNCGSKYRIPHLPGLFLLLARPINCVEELGQASHEDLNPLGLQFFSPPLLFTAGQNFGVIFPLDSGANPT